MIEPKEVSQKVTEKITSTSSNIFSKATGFITAGLGIVVGLAWNDAVQALVKVLFPMDTSSVVAKFSYAIVITVFLVFVSGKLDKLSGK